MKVAVTGASGFVGKAVVAELIRLGVRVIACVHNKHHAIHHMGHDVVAVDIHADPRDSFEKLGRPDVLIHLAWGGLPNYQSLHHFESELPAQYRFLRTLIEEGLGEIVVAGTCFEYGMQYGPLHEELPANPVTSYGYAKNALRCGLEYLKALRPFRLTWARLFYLYGEGQAEGSLFSLLRQAVARGEQIFNMSGGEQLRDYLPVTEAAKLLVTLALAQKDIGIVNVCSGRPISVRRLVESWIRENGWRIDLNLGYYPYPDYEPMAFWGDRRKLDLVLGK